jgi:hypothetical protein
MNMANFDEWHHVTVWRQQMWSVAAFELCSTLWWSWIWNPSLILLWTLPHCTLWPVGAYTQSCLFELQWIWNWVSVVLRLPIGHCVISCSGCEEFYLCWCLCHQCLFSVECDSLSRAGQRRGCVCYSCSNSWLLHVCSTGSLYHFHILYFQLNQVCLLQM